MVLVASVGGVTWRAESVKEEKAENTCSNQIAVSCEKVLWGARMSASVVETCRRMTCT